MALHLHSLATASFCHGKSLKIPSPVSSLACKPTKRRSGNYQPSPWSFDFVQSLKSEYTVTNLFFRGEAYQSKAKKLEEEVKHWLDDRAMGHHDQLELIDNIQRLGLGYLFEEEIKRALDTVACMEDMDTRNETLHVTALRFRLLRQHGYKIGQGIFNHLKDEAGNFIASYLEDVKGVLSLYEASHLAVEGENILYEARHVTKTALKGIKGNKEATLAKLVIHALEVPLHWRMPWMEARWYIDIYDKKENSIPALIELAKLNFNILQAIHQKDLVELSRWWKILGLGDCLDFARDSLIQCYFWAVGLNPEPQFSNFRMEVAMIGMLTTTIDDVYDVYGSLEELELFTNAVERWDIEAMAQLPDYMKICFLALFNTVNEMGYVHFKESGLESIPFLKKVVLYPTSVFFIGQRFPQWPVEIASLNGPNIRHYAWAEVCKAYFVEAKWYYSNHKTTLEEYLNNAVTSVGINVSLIHAFFALRQTFGKEALESLSQYPSLLGFSSMIVRLADDLGTSKAELERGDVLKSVQSFMHKTGASEDVAREHIRHMIEETWKKINKELIANDFLLPQRFIQTTVNLARTSLCVYQDGDGHTAADDESKKRIKSLLFEPIPLLAS